MRLSHLITRSLATLCLFAVYNAHSQEQAAQPDNSSLFLGTKNSIENNRVTAHMNVEGYFFPMIMDTGAGTKLALFKPVVDEIGKTFERVEGTENLYTTTARLGIGDDGKTLSEPISVMVVDTPIVREHYGVIGWPAIKLQIIEINAPQQQWQRHSELPEEIVKDWDSFPIVEKDLGSLIFLVEDNGQERLVCLDTGSYSGVSLVKKTWEQWRQNTKPDWVTLDSAYSPATEGGFSVTKTAVASDFHIGEFQLGEVCVEETFAEIRMNGKPIGFEKIVLGMQVLEHRRVIIDGPGERIYFGPIGESNKDEIRINRAQATWIPHPEDQKKMIASVIKDGVAYRAGLRDGDQVLLVNGGMASNGLKDEDVRPGRVFKDPPGTRVRLIVEREGKRFPITIELGLSPFDRQGEE